jgi:molecular chaperone DnaK
LQKHGADPREDTATLLQFTQDCEDAKRLLSDKAQVPVSLYYQGKTLTVALTRGDLERLTGDLMQRTRDTTELVMQQAGVKPGELDEIVLVGGSTYMPAVEEMLREVGGREPSREVSPEEAVAQGAAIHAAILEARMTGGESKVAKSVLDRLRSVETSDVNSHSLGIKITDPNDRTRKINHIMIPRNTQIPFNVSQQFVTNSANQRSIHVHILEGEASDPAACTLIGDFRIVDLPPNLPQGSPVEVTYSYDANGRIHATAREVTGNREAAAQIVRDSGLDAGGIDSMELLAKEYSVE